MLEIQRSYIHNHKNVEVYFMESNFEHNEPVYIKNDMSSVRVKEDFKTILFKTIATMDSLHRIHGRKFDFIIRTNISTIIDIPKMVRLLKKYEDIEYLYAGDLAGIHINEEPIKFALGTCIILSKKLAIKMIHEKDNFDYSIPDDVAFGLFVTKYCPIAYNNDLKMAPFVYYTSDLPSHWNATLEEFIQFAREKKNLDFICYRNKTNNRLEDVQIMKYISTSMLEK